MNHQDCLERADSSRADRDHLDSSSSGASRGEEQGTPSSSVEPLIITTTDPVIQIVADYQPEWKRDPEATLSLVTSQMGEPMLLATAIPETIAFGRPGWASVQADPEHHLSPEGGFETGPHPPRTQGEIGARRGGPLRLHAEEGPRHFATRRSRAMPSRAAWYPWLIAGAVLLGGLIGSAGCLYFFRIRSQRHS